jgi:hypothetical protein
VIFPGKLPVHLYAAHIIRQSSSLRRWNCCAILKYE